MQFIVLTERLLDTFPLEAFTPELIELESQRVRALYAAGSIRSIWRRKDVPGAVILLEAASEDDVRGLIGSLPLAERGMLGFAVVTALEPYPGFAPR